MDENSHQSDFLHFEHDPLEDFLMPWYLIDVGRN